MKKSWLLKGLVIGTIILLIGSSNVSAFTRKTSNYSKNLEQGNIFYVGGSGPGNYSKIQDAIDNASNGDIVFVYNGTYFENIRVTKSIILTGDDRNSTIIDGNRNGSDITTFVDGITVQNFSIQNSEFNGIEIKSNYTRILRNFIKNNNRTGVQLEGGLNYRRHDNFISENIITNSTSCGIYLWLTNQTTITKNIISYNKRIGIEIILSELITIAENNIFNNEIRGIYVWGRSRDNTIFANTIKNNGGGIRIEDAWKTNITQNNLENDSIILFLSTNNLISKNNFFQSFATFSYDGRSHNIWRGNYWNKPRLLAKPIIGQIGNTILHGEYIPLSPWVNFDWFPAKEPYNISGMRL